LDDIAVALNMATKTVRPILEALEKNKDIRTTGVGVKGDPCLYFGDVIQVSSHEIKPPVEPSVVESPQIPIIPWNQLPVCKGCNINKIAGVAFNTEWGTDFCSTACYGRDVCVN